MSRPETSKPLTIDELAEALYEGTQQLENLAEKLARQHGKAEALTFYSLMGDDIRNFYRGIAKQLIDHAKEWNKNVGSTCVLSPGERVRLAQLPRIQLEAPSAVSLDVGLDLSTVFRYTNLSCHTESCAVVIKYTSAEKAIEAYEIFACSSQLEKRE